MSKNSFKTKDNKYNEFSKELKDIIKYGEWEHKIITALSNQTKSTEKLILVEKEYMSQWQELKGYNKAKEYIFDFVNNKENKTKKIILKEIWDKNLNSQSLSSVILKRLPSMKIDKLLSNVNQKKINNKSNFEFIAEELYPLFQKKMNMKIEKEGIINKGKLMVNIDDKSFYLKYLKNNEFEEILIEIPKEEKNSKKIYNEFIEKDIKLLYNDFIFKNSVKKELFLNDSKNNKYKYYAIPRNKINKIIPIKKNQISKSNSKLKKNSTNNIFKSPPKKLSDKISTKSKSTSKGKESPNSQTKKMKEKKEIVSNSKNISGIKNQNQNASSKEKEKDKDKKIDNISKNSQKDIDNKNNQNDKMKNSSNESNNLLDILEDEINEIEKENEIPNENINDNINTNNINDINNIESLNEKKDDLNSKNRKLNNSNDVPEIVNKKESSASSNKMGNDNIPEARNEENNNTIISFIQEGDEKYNNIAIYESKSKPNPFSSNNSESISNSNNNHNIPYIKKNSNVQSKKNENNIKINDKSNNDSEEVLAIDKNEINYNNPINKKTNKNQEIKNIKIDNFKQNSEKGNNNISCLNSPQTNISSERINCDNNNNIKPEKINLNQINMVEPLKNYKHNTQSSSFDDFCTKTIQNIENLENNKNIDKESRREEPKINKDNKMLNIENDNINELKMNINNKDSNYNENNEKENEKENPSLMGKSMENMNNNTDNNIFNNINESSNKDMEIDSNNITNQPYNQLNNIEHQKEIIINDKNELPKKKFSNEIQKNRIIIENNNDSNNNNNIIIKPQRIKSGVIPQNKIININNQDKIPQQNQTFNFSNNNTSNNNNNNNIPLKTIMIYNNNQNIENDKLNKNKNQLPKVQKVHRISTSPNQNHIRNININKSFNDKRSLPNHNRNNNNNNNKFVINSPKINNNYKVFKINKLYSKSPPPKEKYRMINVKKSRNNNSNDSESQSTAKNPNRIDPNILAQYMLFKRLENNELKEELRNEKDQIQLENKVLKRNLSWLEKEKEKFKREKKMFLDSRDRIIKDFRMNEERLKKLENDLENKFMNKKNEIDLMKMRLNEKENNLNNEKEKIRNEYEIKIKNMENKYQMKNNEDLNRKEYELRNKEIELRNKENDLNNKYQDLQNLNEEKMNKENHINMLNKEIQDKEIKIIELENKYNELSSSMNTNKINTFNDNKSDINTIGNNNIYNSNRKELSYNDESAQGELDFNNIKDNNDTPEDNDIYLESSIDKIKEELFIEKYNPCIGLCKTEGPNYINEILQCFAHISEITEYLINIHLDPYFKDKLSNLKLSKYYREVLINLFFPEKVFNINSRPYKPNNFVNNLYNLNSLFQKNSYIDYKEFLDYFIIKLHDELNVKKSKNNYSNEKNLTLKNENDVLVEFLKNFTNKNNSIISKYLYGICKNTLYCHKCRNTFYNFHYYSYLYFDLSKVIEYKQNKYRNDDITINITDCLNYYQRTQTLLGDKGLFCPACKELTESTSIKNLYSSKTILLFVLNRDNQFNARESKINLEEVIDIGDYVEFNKEKEGKNNKEKFYLSGVVSYFGDNYGNETFSAYCKMNKDDQWYCYDNENVFHADFKDIRNNGYPIILLYHKILRK